MLLSRSYDVGQSRRTGALAVSESEDFLKLRDIADKAECLMESTTPSNTSGRQLREMDALVESVIPLLEVLNLKKPLETIREAVRKRKLGIPRQDWEWIMTLAIHFRSACDVYGWEKEKADRAATAKPAKPAVEQPSAYVSESRIAQIRSLQSELFDFAKLVRLCEELNIASEHNCHIAVASLVRTIGNHVPPIFAARSIAEVAAQSPKSVKNLLDGLSVSMKNIADHHLHDQIKKNVSLPTAVQVNCSRELDMLLGEIVRKVSSE